jgi:hypothetical protein
MGSIGDEFEELGDDRGSKPQTGVEIWPASVSSGEATESGEGTAESGGSMGLGVLETGGSARASTFSPAVAKVDARGVVDVAIPFPLADPIDAHETLLRIDDGPPVALLIECWEEVVRRRALRLPSVVDVGMGGVEPAVEAPEAFTNADGG